MRQCTPPQFPPFLIPPLYRPLLPVPQLFKDPRGNLHPARSHRINCDCMMHFMTTHFNDSKRGGGNNTRAADEVAHRGSTVPLTQGCEQAYRDILGADLERLQLWPASQ